MIDLHDRIRGEPQNSHDISNRAPIIQEIYRRYLADESPHAIAKDLNSRGVDPPKSTGKSANRQARRGEPIWQAATVKNLLRNPILGGFASYHGHRVKKCDCGSLEQPEGWAHCGPDHGADHDWTRSLKGHLPALVDEETWEAAQRQVASRRGRVFGGRRTGGAAKTFLLNGSSSAVSAARTWPAERARQTNVVDRYVCQGRRTHGCTMPTIKRTLLDEALREHAVNHWIIDTEASVRRERDRLLAERDEEAAATSDVVKTVESDSCRSGAATPKGSTEVRSRRPDRQAVLPAG
jgi:site-specific DNA recombinase